MQKVAVVGAGGRMGQEVCRAVSDAEDLELVAAVDPNHVGEHAAGRRGASGESDVIIGATSAVLRARGAEVVVDFSVAEAARDNLAFYAEEGLHAVIGTTGLTEAELAGASNLFAASEANAIVASNFAIGAVLLMRFGALAAPHMDGVEVIELHHDAKRDAPSGTALHTAEAIAEARTRAGSGPWPADPTTEHVLPGARGGRAPAACGCTRSGCPGSSPTKRSSSVRVGQSLSIRHDSYDRRSFMPGVLLAVRAVPDHPGLTVGIEALLGL